MATDYILFIHGVNTRQQREGVGYSKSLFDLIHAKVKTLNPTTSLKQVELYWGDINKTPEDQLRNDLEKSPAWNKFWFKDFRQNQLLQFAGDAALYISRYIGSKVVDRLLSQIEEGLRGYQSNEDRIHLVTHSWGTVILFDVLFASRWKDTTIPGFKGVDSIRRAFFGIEPSLFEGIKIGSLHTMGSPIAIFSLMDVQQDVDETKTESSSTHDITPKLELFLKNLAGAKAQKPLPWRNFAHPGDPIAFPLAATVSRMVNEESKYLNVQDIITHNSGLFDYLTEPVSQTVLALVHGGDAHGSYWTSHEVAQKIADEIHQSS
jgi:hypothetical protein